MASEPESLDEKLRRVNRALWIDRGIVGRLEAVTALCKRMIEGCDGAGLALQVRGETRSLAITDHVVLEVDLVQYDTGEGPCLAAIKESSVVRIDVLEGDEQWQHFAPGALDRGIESVLSLPIEARNTTIGALNLYSRSQEAFDEGSEAAGQPLADYAGEVIGTSPLYAYSVELLDEVLEELANSELINTAVGLLMARRHQDADTAMRELTVAAEENGATLREAAEWELREQQFRVDGDVSDSDSSA